MVGGPTVTNPAEGGGAPTPPPTTEERLDRIEVALHRLYGERPSPVTSWLTLTDPDVGVDLLADLVDWVHSVWLSWPDAALPACWIRHPSVVEELWALRNLWDAHTARGGTWGARVDWLERYRPSAAKRLTAIRCRGESCGGNPDRLPDRPTSGEITGLAARHCSTERTTSYDY